MHIKNSFLIKQFDNVPKKYNGLLFEEIGLLVTERYSIIIKGIIIYLDKNYYNGQIDYEIEIEFTTNTLPYAIDVIDTLQLKDKKSNYGKKKRLLRSINYKTRERKEN